MVRVRTPRLPGEDDDEDEGDDDDDDHLRQAPPAAPHHDSACRAQVLRRRGGARPGSGEAVAVEQGQGAVEVLSTPTHETPFVYFLRTPGPAELCAPGTPLTYRNVAVYRIGPGGKFDLDTWRGAGGISYTLSAEAGVLTSSRGEIY